MFDQAKRDPDNTLMNVHFQRALDRTAGVWICRLVSLFVRVRATGSARSQPPQRILVVLLSEMGSLVLACPMLDRLRRKYPDAVLHTLVFEQNREVLDLLKVVQPDNIFTVSNTSLVALLRTGLIAIRNIRRRNIDTVIDCELFARIGSILSLLSGARNRVGFHPHTMEGLSRGRHINRPVLYNPYVHISRQFVNMAEAIDARDVPLVKRRMDGDVLNLPVPDIHPDEIERLRKRLAGDFSGMDATRLVLIYPGGGLLPIRAWPLGHFAEVATRLIEEGYWVAVIGLPQDRDAAVRIQQMVNNGQCIDLTGYTKSLRELILLFHIAALLISNDGGPGHFAALTPIRTIVLYGPETPALYGSLKTGTRNLFAGLSCSPCLTAYNHRNSPCNGDNKCLKAITPGEVLDEAIACLDLFG